MFFNIYVFLASVVFFLGLEIMAFWGKVYFYAFPFLLLLTLWIVKKLGKRWYFVSVSLVFFVSCVALLYFIDPVFGKHIFSLLSGLMFYLSSMAFYRLGRYQKDKTAQGIISALLMVNIFFFYTAIYGIYINFVVNLWILMIAFLIGTFIISYQGLNLMDYNKKKINLVYCAILSLLMAEFAWVISLWPFGNLTTGVISLVVYYLFWDLTQSYLMNFFSKKRVWGNLFILGILMIAVLLTSKWLPG